MKKTALLRVELNRTKPLIWREFLIPFDFTFYQLHHTLQIIMGWENYHLFEFMNDQYRIGIKYKDDPFAETENLMESHKVQIHEVLQKKGQQINYLYDFGDHWEHTITLVQLLNDVKIPAPFCCEGEFNCPPEDVGGIPEFYDFLESYFDPKNPEKEELREWVLSKMVSEDEEYYPERFYLMETNIVLSQLEYYIYDWEHEE